MCIAVICAILQNTVIHGFQAPAKCEALPGEQKLWLGTMFDQQLSIVMSRSFKPRGFKCSIGNAEFHLKNFDFVKLKIKKTKVLPNHFKSKNQIILKNSNYLMETFRQSTVSLEYFQE